MLRLLRQPRMRFSAVLVLLSLTLAALSVAAAPVNQGDPVPTLVPPTLVPVVESGEAEVVPSESAVARIQRDGVLRVGVLFNAQPFAWLNVRGVVAGYEPDIARSMADLWGVDIEFVQVTRDTDAAISLLRRGEVDLLAAALVHSREMDAQVQFSQTIYLGGQAVMVRAEDPAQSPADMGGRSLGVVLQTPAEAAAAAWINRTGSGASLQTFLTLDRAYVALAEGRIDGVVDTAVRLQQVSALQPDTVRILEEPLEAQPHAFAMVRQDVHLRNLVNRTLQFLVTIGRMDEINQVFFPGTAFTLIEPWPGLGEEPPTPGQFGTDLPFPQAFTIPQLQAGRALRVAGLYGVTADSDAPESERRLDTLHRALVDAMAARWGVPVEYLPGTATNPADLVARGEADLAVGVLLDWALLDSVDVTQPYLIRGERLMVRVNDNIATFEGLRGGGVVATPNNEPTAAARAVDIAEGINVRIEIVQFREQDLAFALLEDDEVEAEVVFGDSVRLIPHVRQFPDLLRLTTAEDRGLDEPWYSRQPVVFAVPRNDVDFRLLVEYTLQELYREGVLSEVLLPLMLPEDRPTLEIWPGSTDYLGYRLSGG